MRFLTKSAVCALLAVFLPVSGIAFAQAGAVSGTVTDSSGNPLPGAEVIVQGRTQAAVTNDQGVFSISGLAPGSYTVTVSYLGYEPATQEVTIDEGATPELEFALEQIGVEEQVIVTAQPIRTSQARALNQQKNAVSIENVVSSDQIGRFPDQNSAEATQRIPGVIVERDQGEGRFIRVRGTAPRFNSSNINGVRLPSPEGDIRSVALDVVPAGILDSIVVTKALTPDMEADSIGGAVNLRTRVPSGGLRYGFGADGGYADLRGSGNYGFDGFVSGRLGGFDALVNGSYQQRDFGSDNFEISWDDELPEELELRNYTITRKRTGLNATLDHKYGVGSNVRVFGVYNRFSDQEYRRGRVDIYEDGEIEKELKDRFESQEIFAAAVTGSNIATSGIQVDYELSYAYADENEPDAQYSIYKAEDIDFDPVLESTDLDETTLFSNAVGDDIDAYEFDERTYEDNSTSDRNYAARIDVTYPLFEKASGVLLKGGIKYRRQEKDQNVEVFEIDAGNAPAFADIIDADFERDDFLEGYYDIGPFQSPDGQRGITGEVEKDLEEDTGDYEAQENIIAGYVMSEIYLNDRAMLLPGVRFESTDTNYTANEVLFDADGDFAGITPVNGGRTYTEWFPGLHFRYGVDLNTNFRAAVTRSMSRPNFDQLVPFRLIIAEDDEIELGNPDLDPTTSWNFDLLAERYFESVGVVSGGFFYKRLSNDIVDFTFDGDFNGDEYEFTQPLNADNGRILGFELAYQNQFRNGLGLYLNYTFADGEQDILGRDDKVRIPGQARHSGNAGVSYERGGFSGAVLVNFHADYLEALTADPVDDEFIDTRWQLDIKTGYQFTEQLRGFLEFLNLGNQPWRRFIGGDSSRPLQNERYSWWIRAGVKFNVQ